eukprot:9390211-Pyramimonas_sp.AAC.1
MALVYLHNSCSHECWHRRTFRHLDVLAMLAEDRRRASVHRHLRLRRVGLELVTADVVEVVGVPGVATMLLLE